MVDGFSKCFNLFRLSVEDEPLASMMKADSVISASAEVVEDGRLVGSEA